jgi:hypothetical protein
MAWVVGMCLAASGVIAGCSQSTGETCQVNADCESGLICCRPNPEVPRGTCQKTCDIVQTPTDAGSDTSHDANMSMPADAGASNNG